MWFVFARGAIGEMSVCACVSVCGSERLLIDFCEQVATRTAKQVSDVAYKEPENATETVKWVSERRRGTTVQVGEMSWWTRASCCVAAIRTIYVSCSGLRRGRPSHLPGEM